MDIQIRHALTDDLNGILRVFQQCADYHAALMPDVYGPVDMEAFKNSILEQMANEDWTHFVAMDNDDVIGYLSLQIRRHRRQYGNKADENGRVDCLVVDENHRHQGIGSRLMGAAEAYLQKQNIHEMTLTVLINNFDAIKCYEKAGFHNYIYSMKKDLS